MQKVTGKRLLAYFIDSLFIVIMSGIFGTINILNPYSEKYEKVYNEYEEIINDYYNSMYNSEISESLQENHSSEISKTNYIFDEEKIVDLSYKISKYSLPVSIITLVISFLYYIVFQYFNKGKTLGKALMKIKVVSDGNKNPSLLQLLLRSLFVDGLITSLASILLLAYTSKSVYINHSQTIVYIDAFILMLTALFMMFRKDGKGIHDLYSKTNVISTNKIKEANYEEK